MTLELGIADYVIIILILCLSASVGLYFRFTGGRQKTIEEYLMAGKNMTVLPVAFSLMATFLSAVSMMGVPADVYMYGTQYLLFILGIPIGAVIASYVFLPVFFEMQAKTTYEYLEKRFGKTTRIIASLLFNIQMILYMAVVLYAPSLAFNAVTGFSTWGSVLTLAGVCTFYCSLGGLKAVLWSDVLQATLMYVTLVSVVVKGTIDLGGILPSLNIANNGNRLKFFKSLHTSVPLIIVFLFLCTWNGVIVYSLYHDCDPILKPNATVSSPDQMLPYTVLTLFEQFPGLAGLCISGIFSASLSSVSSAMNSLTAVTIEDFIRPYSFGKRLSESWTAFLAKFIGMAYGGICLLLILLVSNFRGILEAAFALFGMIAGPVQGIFTLGVVTTTANELGALMGLFAALFLNAWMCLGSYTVKIEIPHLLRSIQGCTSVSIQLPNNETMFDKIDLPEGSMNLNYTKESQDVFPLYKVSFLWYEIFGTWAAIIFGYICSYIVGCIWGRKGVKPELISPPLRKWLFKYNDDIKTLQEIQPLDAKENGEVASDSNCHKQVLEECFGKNIF